MDIVEVFFDKGPTFAALVVSVALVGYFIRKDREDREKEFKEYKDQFKLIKDEMTKTAVTTRSASAQTVQTLKLEFGAFRAQIEPLIKSFEDLKAQVIKESFSLKVHTTQLHERSEKLKEMMDLHMEKLGRVLDIKERADLALGQVKVVDAKIDRQAENHRKNMTQTAEILAKQAIEISNIKRGKS